MTYLRGFLPWIAFAILSSLIGWQWGALAALAVTGWSLVRDRRAGIALDGQILDLGGAVFFGALATLAFAAPHSPLEAYDGALSSAWLALVAGVGLALGRPFTLAIARRQVAPEVAQLPAFVRVNTVITRAWAAAFAAGAVAGAVAVAVGAPESVQLVVQVSAFGVPVLFTRAYVTRLRARHDHATRVPAEV